MRKHTGEYVTEATNDLNEEGPFIMSVEFFKH